MYNLIAVIVLLAYLGLREFLFYKERDNWNKERQKLLDRIQSNSLAEYKAFEEKPEIEIEEPENPFKNYEEV